MEKKSKAKKEMLSALSKDMREMMGEGLSDSLKDKMMKVTVAGDSEEAVEKGLDKAKEIMKRKMGEDYMNDDMEENDRSPEEIEDLEEAEEEAESREELEEKIEELKKKLSELKE